MGIIDRLLVRLILWFGLPIVLLLLVVGPRKLWRGIKFGWHWLFQRRLQPEELLAHVLRQHQDHIEAVRRALSQAEAVEVELRSNVRKSAENVDSLEAEARRHVAQQDDLGAKAALYKLNLEQKAIDSFQEQLARQSNLISESRRRLYLLELQLRQYEVGRGILLSQLAEAKSTEQQYAIASRFDPFNAIEDWKKAEGIVQEKAISARAMERVYADTNDLAGTANPAAIDLPLLETQMARLRAALAPPTSTETNAAAQSGSPAARPGVESPSRTDNSRET
jgi:phage shock protein A